MREHKLQNFYCFYGFYTASFWYALLIVCFQAQDGQYF